MPRAALLITLCLIAGCAPRAVVPAGAPDTALARQQNDLAFDLIGKGKYLEALPLLERAINADPYYGPAHNNLGIVYYHTDSLANAGRSFETALRNMPNQPDARNNLGLVFERLNRPTDAATEYERARRLAPENPEYLANLCRARYKLDPRDPGLTPLLRELVAKTRSAEWRTWAETNLLRLSARPPEDSATRPTPPAPR
ncbi:MAG TPA: tetratricopeptide repeat protein [Tepidisphaeraceae bacterium]|nr:tetratricopeptide repeat protein [Tepidisphaeraceae bacterium]